jgi:hypothetical protein
MNAVELYLRELFNLNEEAKEAWEPLLASLRNDGRDSRPSKWCCGHAKPQQ